MTINEPNQAPSGPGARSSESVREYGRMLLKLHELDPRGENDAPELNSLTEQMDGPWNRLNGKERKRVKGLSEDLYALADGRHGVAMSTEERQQWLEAARIAEVNGGPDLLLEHLRRPFPQDVSPGMIAQCQGQCWEQIGDLDVAVVFMLDACKSNPGSLHLAIDFLERLGRIEQARDLAMVYLNDRHLPLFDRYLISGKLFSLARGMDSAKVRQLYEEIVPVLQEVIKNERKTPHQQRKIPQLEVRAARSLSLTFSLLGKYRNAVATCTEALLHNPNNGDLLIARGLVHIERDEKAAEVDFEQAIAARVQSGLPYVALAFLRLNQQRYFELLSLSTDALRFSDTPDRYKANLHEWRGIAYSELKQRKELVEEEFRQACSLDPSSSERIKHNQKIAMQRSGAVSAESSSNAERGWSIPRPELSAADLWKKKTGSEDIVSPTLRNRKSSGCFTDLATVS